MSGKQIFGSKRWACLAFLLLLLISKNVNARGIVPFTSDGCSRFPDGTMEHKSLWLSCCSEHDYSYWKGGTYSERLDADNKLKECVASVGEPEIGALMKFGVRFGGSPYFPTSYRWGYGWHYLRGYSALTEQELKEIERMENKQLSIHLEKKN